MLILNKGKKRPIGYISPGGYKKTAKGWRKVQKVKRKNKVNLTLQDSIKQYSQDISDILQSIDEGERKGWSREKIAKITGFMLKDYDKYRKHLVNVKTYIKRASKSDRVLYRGTKVKKLSVGDSYIIEGVTSFSAGGLADDFADSPHVIVIRNNTRGASIRDLSIFPAEEEVIVPHGKYKVVNKERKDGKTYFYLEEQMIKSFSFMFKGKKRPLGYITPGGYKKTPKGWVKVKKVSGKRKTKIKIADFYGKGKHKYFDTLEDKKDFMKRIAAGMVGGKKGAKKKTAVRIKVGTLVTVTVAGKTKTGKVVATHKKHKTTPPYAFDVEITDANKKVQLLTAVPRDQLGKKELTSKQKRLVLKQRKSEKMKTEARDLEVRGITEDIKKQANDLLIANWDIFSKMTGKYYKQRVNAGFDASKFGFTEEDLKQEVFILLQKAATSFLTNPAKYKNASFKNYVMSFLKSNLAAKIAAAAGTGNHMKKADKEQMYLWFFRDTLDEYRQKHGKYPDDVTLVGLLEKKRKTLEDKKGNKLIKNYKWTVEKVRNKKALAKKTISLEQAMEYGPGDSADLLNILGSENMESIPGHLKIDPWIEVQKKFVTDGVKSAILRKFRDAADKQILIRLYGLFVDEDSPQEVRNYAMGQTPAEVARVLNDLEAKRGSRKIWTSDMVEERELQLLQLLKKDKLFRQQLGDFVKSEKSWNWEWPDAGLILYWVAAYDTVSWALRDIGQIVSDGSTPDEPELAFKLVQSGL